MRVCVKLHQECATLTLLLLPGRIELTRTLIKAAALLVGPTASSIANAFPHATVGRQKSCNQISAHTAPASDRATIVYKRLLQNLEKGMLLYETIHEPIMKVEYNSRPLLHESRIRVHLDSSQVRLLRARKFVPLVCSSLAISAFESFTIDWTTS